MSLEGFSNRFERSQQMKKSVDQGRPKADQVLTI